MMKPQRSAAILVSMVCIALMAGTPTRSWAKADTALRDLENSFVEIAERVKPSVVHLTAERRPLKGLKGEEFFGKLPFDPERFRAHATGSGVIIDKEGYILTNYHLVENSERITVKITNSENDKGKEYEGRILGRDVATDLAVIKIDPEKPLQEARLGDSSKLRVGQWAIAIGDPFGIEKTVTVGVISGLGRSGFRGPLSEVRYQDFIQTDASINPGNSGGPLLNLSGDVIGINTFIQAAGRGMGFAIPIAQAKEVYDQLAKHGEVIRGFLGVEIGDLSEGMAAAMKVPTLKGALVHKVMPDTPAEKAGVQHGDVIRKVDGRKVDDSKELANIISHKRPGDKVQLTLLREGKEKEFTVELIKFPTRIAAAKKPKKNPLGLSVDKTPEKMARPGEKGVIITNIEVGGPADEAGLSEGDIILEINMREVHSAAAFRKTVSALEPGQWVSFYIRRGDDMLYRALKVPTEE